MAENESSNVFLEQPASSSLVLIENQLYAICSSNENESINLPTSNSSENSLNGTIFDQTTIKEEQLDEAEEANDDLSRNSVSCLVSAGPSLLTVNDWIGCDVILKTCQNAKIIENKSFHTKIITSTNGESQNHLDLAIGEDFTSGVDRTLGILGDSLSNTILRGNDICLPTYETFSQTNSIEKLPNNESSTSRTVGFFDSNHSGPEINPYANPSSLLNYFDNFRAKKSYECKICGREFDRPVSLIVHNRKHNGQKPYQCLICGRTFTQTSNIKRHVETHKIYPHIAPKSTSEYNFGLNGPTFNRTVDLMNDYSTYSIEPCSFKAKNNSETESSAKNPFAFACPYCEKLFDCAKCSQHHLPMHRDRKVFQCTLRSCRHLIETLSEYLKHVKVHEGEMIYTCPLCSKQFHSLNEIGVHQSTHVFTDETKKIVSSRSYCCFTCGAVFKTLESFESHRSNTNHNYACKRCPRVYSNGRQLRRHIKTCHSNCDKFLCEVCNKKFSHPYTYKVHMKRHTEQKQFKCNHCEKFFNRQDILRRHVTTVHLSATPYQCSFEGCSKTFKRVDRLKEHVLTHNSSNRKHECVTCGKSFLRQRAYNMHVSSVHLKTYRLQCDICKKGFNRPDVLRKHLAKCKTDYTIGPSLNASIDNVAHYESL